MSPLAVGLVAAAFAAVVASTVFSAWLAARNSRRLERQNTRLAEHVERLTFAFVAKIPDALSGTRIYDKIGQEIGIQRLVVNLYDRVMADADLKPFFTGVDLDRLRAHQVSMYQALFGLGEYDGVDLSIVHADLGINGSHFDRLLDHVRDTLISFGLSDDDQAAVMGWLEQQRAGIAEAH